MQVKSQRGFSLLELMAAVAVLLVISAAAFSLLNYFQKNYTSNQLSADMHSGVRGAIELISQELTQAGLINSSGVANTSLTSSVVSSGNSQNVAVGNAGLFYAGERVSVDTGVNAEVVQVINVDSTGNKITGIFTQNHTTGAPVYATGVIGNGVTVSPGTLDILGDVNADGSLYLVEYVCDPATGTLSRSATPVSQANKNPGQALVTSVKGCSFSASTAAVNGVSYVTDVALTLTVQTAQIDPQTGMHGVMMSTFDLSPRNITAAMALAQAGQTVRLQPAPSPLPQ